MKEGSKGIRVEGCLTCQILAHSQLLPDSCHTLASQRLTCLMGR